MNIHHVKKIGNSMIDYVRLVTKFELIHKTFNFVQNRAHTNFASFDAIVSLENT